MKAIVVIVTFLTVLPALFLSLLRLLGAIRMGVDVGNTKLAAGLTDKWWPMLLIWSGTVLLIIGVMNLFTKEP